MDKKEAVDRFNAALNSASDMQNELRSITNDVMEAAEHGTENIEVKKFLYHISGILGGALSCLKQTEDAARSVFVADEPSEESANA